MLKSSKCSSIFGTMWSLVFRNTSVCFLRFCFRFKNQSDLCNSYIRTWGHRS